MSMFTLSGTLVNTFTAPLRKNAEEGEVEKDKLQIMGKVPLRNGQSRMELITISVDDAKAYDEQRGKSISLPVGVFAPAKGNVVFFVTSG